VNEVTPELFTLAPDAAAMAALEIAVVQRIIQPIGLAPTKAKNLVNMSKVSHLRLARDQQHGCRSLCQPVCPSAPCRVEEVLSHVNSLLVRASLSS
jgi:endonuclease III